MILFLTTLLFFPFALHPAIGFIIKNLSVGKKKRALILALSAGLFYDLSSNHLPFGLITIIWIVATCIVEAFRRLFFLGKLKELILGTLLFSFILEASQGLFLGYLKASLSFQPLYEAFVSLLIIWAVPLLLKIYRFRRRLRSARS